MGRSAHHRAVFPIKEPRRSKKFRGPPKRPRYLIRGHGRSEQQGYPTAPKTNTKRAEVFLTEEDATCLPVESKSIQPIHIGRSARARP
jgi:hypothetical protein